MMQFPIQNNPSKIDQGINKGFDFYTKLLQSLAMPEMMKTQQQAAQADLLKTQLANQYYPQATQADIGYKGALGNEANERAKVMPLNSLVGAQNATTALSNANRLQQTRGPAYGLFQGLAKKSPADRQAFIAQHPDLYNSILNGYVNEIKSQQEENKKTIPNLLSQDTVNQILGIKPSGNQDQGLQSLGVAPPKNANMPPRQPAIVGNNLQGAPTGENSSLNINPQQFQEAAKSLGEIPDMDQSSEGEIPKVTIGDPNSTKGWTSNQMTAWTEADAANRSVTGPQLQNRKQQAIALMNVMYEPDIQKAFVKLSDPRFLGMLGKSQLYLKEHFNPKDVAEYISIRDRLPSLLSGSFKGLENLPTSTPGMEASSKFFNTANNKKAWIADPQAQLIDTLSGYSLADAEARAIINSAQPIIPTYQLPKGSPPIVQAALDQYQNKDKNAKNVMDKSGLGNSNQEFPHKIENGRQFLQAPDGKWYPIDQLVTGNQ